MTLQIENVIELKPSLENNTTVGPGVQLRHARERLRLSKADIARQLKLKLFFIDAIENEDYIKLPALTFVRGYLRAYAGVVNLPGDDIVQLFNQLGISEIPTPISRQVFYDKHEASREKILRIITSAIVASLAILFFTWWYSEKPTHTEIHPAIPIATTTVKPVVTAAKPTSPAPVASVTPPPHTPVPTLEKSQVQLPPPATQDIIPPSED